MTVIDRCLQDIDMGPLMYVDRTPVRQYLDGKPTDQVIGYRYICALPKMGYQQIGIKILGDAQLDIPTVPIQVVCDGLQAKAYTNRRNRPDIAFSASAIAAKG